MRSDLKRCVIIGSGDYGKEVAWVIHDLNQAAREWNLLGFIDPPAVNKTQHCGLPVWHSYEAFRREHGPVFFACGIANPAYRAKECNDAEQHGFCPATLVHPTVVVAPGVSIGTGTIVGAGTVVAPDAVIGRHCAINVQATIGHDCSLGDFSVISPGARVLGHVTLMPRAFVGANAVIYQGLRMGEAAVLGAGSFLAKDLDAGQSAFGVPARSFLPASVSGPSAPEVAPNNRNEDSET
jgi:sugar O-acyltransferase (sialic acid O-acetyltransferase NeuD family)